MYSNNSKCMFSYLDRCYVWHLVLNLSCDKRIIKQFNSYDEAFIYAENFDCNYSIYKSLMVRECCKFI